MRGNAKWRFLGSVALFGFALGLVFVPQQAASSSPQSADSSQSTADEPVPAFHAQAPQGEMPATMDPGVFTDPVVQNAYAVAAKIKKTLYQQPCYTKASWIASPASTVQDAEPVFTKTSTRSSSWVKGRPLLRLGQASSRANGNRSTRPSTSSPCRQSDSCPVAAIDSEEHPSEVPCHATVQFVNYSYPSQT